MNDLNEPASRYPTYIIYNTWMKKLVEQFSAGALSADDAGAIIFSLCQPYRDALKAELIEREGKFFAAGFLKASERSDTSRIATLIKTARARKRTASPTASFTFIVSEIALMEEGEMAKSLEKDR